MILIDSNASEGLFLTVIKVRLRKNVFGECFIDTWRDLGGLKGNWNWICWMRDYLWNFLGFIETINWCSLKMCGYLCHAQIGFLVTNPS